MPKITPFLWFDDNAEEAMNFYASVFKDSKIVSIMRHRATAMGPKARCSPRHSGCKARNSSR